MILISIAHNAIDRGAHNETYAVSEYELSQKMSYACKDELNANGLQAMIYDIGEHNPHKAQKIRTVNMHEPQLAIEIHLNSAATIGRYSSCFYEEGDELTSKISTEFAPLMRKFSCVKAVKKIGLPCEGYDIKRYWFITDVGCPSMIFEPLFINNDEHVSWLLSVGNLEKVGRDIGRAIVNGLGNKSHI